MSIEVLPDVEALAMLLLDGSRSMRETEVKTGELKHRCVASMTQDIIDAMDDPQYEYANATVACFSADSSGAKVVCLLEDHNPYTLKTYTENRNLDYWDPLSSENCTQGMGNLTPLGTALAWAREKAEQWVNAADGQVQRRAVIYLLSDGMNNYGPDGMEEKNAIADFNAACEKGYIRLATIGYFQSPPDTHQEEDAGRQLLHDLPLNPKAYFESDNAKNIFRYILSTLTQVMHHA